MTFVGFDLHTRYITACALDASGEIVAEIRQLSTALESVLAWLGALPGPVTAGLEATLYWEWLATRLAEHEHGVRVAHAFHVKLIWQARQDRFDRVTNAPPMPGSFRRRARTTRWCTCWLDCLC